MDLRELRKIARRGENQRVEFKKKLAHPEKVVREVVAFANAEGGHLLLGVDDDGQLSGLDHPDDDEYMMSKAIDELCKPSVRYQVEVIPINDSKSVLHYEVFAGDAKPYYAFLQKHHRLGKAYVRIGDRSVQASKELRKTLQKERSTQGRAFSYGEFEKAMIKYLGINDHITLSKFCELTKLSIEEASHIVIKLAENHVIRIIPREEEDWYVFAE